MSFYNGLLWPKIDPKCQWFKALSIADSPGPCVKHVLWVQEQFWEGICLFRPCFHGFSRSNDTVGAEPFPQIEFPPCNTIPPPSPSPSPHLSLPPPSPPSEAGPHLRQPCMSLAVKLRLLGEKPLQRGEDCVEIEHFRILK